MAREKRTAGDGPDAGTAEEQRQPTLLNGGCRAQTGALIECLRAVDQLPNEEVQQVMWAVAAYRGITL